MVIHQNPTIYQAYVLGRKCNRRKGENTPPYYLSCKEITGNYAFTEDPALIDYNRYKERLKTALEGLLAVRNYSTQQIKKLLGLAKPSLI